MTNMDFFSWGSMECIWMELEKDQLKETREFHLRVEK
jgi:hypothetical protein